MTRYTFQYDVDTPDTIHAYMAESADYPDTAVFRCTRCTLEWEQGTDQGTECPVCDHCHTCNDTRKVDNGIDGTGTCPACCYPPEDAWIEPEYDSSGFPARPANHAQFIDRDLSGVTQKIGLVVWKIHRRLYSPGPQEGKPLDRSILINLFAYVASRSNDTLFNEKIDNLVAGYQEWCITGGAREGR